MKTTALFAELMVIGVGAIGALTVFFMAFFPLPDPSIFRVSPLLFVPALAVLYLVGIVADRLGDYFSENFLGKISFCSVEVSPEIKKARARLLDKNVFFREMWQYSKSRSRIVRGWILNSIFLMIAWIIVAIKGGAGFCDTRMAILWGLCSMVLSVVCLFVWRRMNQDEIRAINYWKNVDG